MPSRLMIGVILAFWLTMTGLLIQREVVPMMLADASPSYQPDLTDEIGAPQIAWTVKRGGIRAGMATSRIIAKEDRTYAFHSSFHFDRTFLQVKQIESLDHVGENGKLKAISIKFTLESGTTGEIRGEVVNAALRPRVFIDNVENKFLDLGKIDMAHQGTVVNPMSLVSRLRGLRDGQTWKIVMIDPFRGIENKLVGDLVKQMAVPMLIAKTSTDILQWDRRPVACYKIEYHEAGKEVSARTWVRKSDGLVLQQDSSHLGFEMVLERVP